MIGSKKVESSGMNQHKVLAGAGQSGNFGCSPFPCKPMAHPDAGMSHEAMADSARGTPPSGGRQAAPDHAAGKGMKDHFARAGKL